MHYQNFINGKFVRPETTAILEVRNPSTGAPICTVPDSGGWDIEKAVWAAEAAQKEWSRRPAVERAKLLRAIAAKIREQVEPLARIITEEQGKVLGLARQRTLTIHHGRHTFISHALAGGRSLPDVQS